MAEKVVQLQPLTTAPLSNPINSTEARVAPAHFISLCDLMVESCHAYPLRCYFLLCFSGNLGLDCGPHLVGFFNGIIFSSAVQDPDEEALRRSR